MQAPVAFDGERVVRPLRWIARALGGVSAVVFALAALLALNTVGRGEAGMQVWDFVAVAAIVAGIAIAIRWKGIGEIVGGLIIVGFTVAYFFEAQTVAGLDGQRTNQILWSLSLPCSAPFIIPGVLFIICGGYALMHRHAGPPLD